MISKKKYKCHARHLKINFYIKFYPNRQWERVQILGEGKVGKDGKFGEYCCAITAIKFIIAVIAYSYMLLFNADIILYIIIILSLSSKFIMVTCKSEAMRLPLV